MKIRALLFFTLCFVFLSTVVISSKPAVRASSGWQVKQACLETFEPPADWTFDGTIVMQGNSGIHTYQHGWATPHVSIFLNPQFALREGELSPDGNWYAYPWGEFYITESYNHLTEVEELRVHNTHDDREYSVPYETFGYLGTYIQAQWIDNEHILFENAYINPFSGEMETWKPLENRTFESTSIPYYPSRDWSAFVSPRLNVDAWSLYILEDGSYKLVSDIPIDTSPVAVIGWSPDAQKFAAFADHTISLFDLDGTIADTIYTLTEEYPFAAPDSIRWSSDGRYITFVLTEDDWWKYSYNIGGGSEYSYGANRLFIADTQEQTVIDTCLEVGWGVAWSPNVNELALVGPNEGQAPLQILDVASWSLYTVAYHGVSYRTAYNDNRVILGWSAD